MHKTLVDVYITVPWSNGAGHSVDNPNEILLQLFELVEEEDYTV